MPCYFGFKSGRRDFTPWRMAVSPQEGQPHPHRGANDRIEVGGRRAQAGRQCLDDCTWIAEKPLTVELPGQIRSNQRDLPVYWMRPRINTTPKSGSCNDQNCNVNGDKDIKSSPFLAFGTRTPLQAMRRGPSLASMKRELLALSATCCRKRETVEAGNRPASLRFGAGKLPEAAQCVMSAPRKPLPYWWTAYW